VRAGVSGVRFQVSEKLPATSRQLRANCQMPSAKCRISKILPATLTGSRFYRPFPKRNYCFQDFTGYPQGGYKLPASSYQPPAQSSRRTGFQLEAGGWELGATNCGFLDSARDDANEFIAPIQEQSC
jgi:hypothetical protein